MKKTNPEPNKIFNNVLWAYGERLLAQLVSFIVSVCLARILSTEENGIVALVLIIITIANVFVTEGFSSALIQNNRVDELDYSSVLIFSFFCSIILYCVIFLISPYLEKIYGVEGLSELIRVLSIRLPIASINSVQQAYIAKNMLFKKFFFATIYGTVISAVVGISLAYKGFGVWALVFQYLTNVIIDTVVLSFVIDWKLKLHFKWARVKGLMLFSVRVLLVSLCWSVYSSVRDLVIGKKYSVTSLSYSNKGNQIPSIIGVNISNALTKVLFPALSDIQDDLNKLKELTRSSIKYSMFVLSPIMIGLCSVSYTFIKLIYTSKWLPCVPYLRIMCLVYLLQPIQIASLQAMKALGESKLYLKLQIIKLVFGIGSVLLSLLLFDSVYAVVISSLVAEIFATSVNFPYNKKLFKYNYFEQLFDVIKPLSISLIMFLVVSNMNDLVDNLFINFLFQLSIGVIIYLGGLYLLKDESLLYFIKKIKDRKGKNDDTTC